MRGPYYDGSGSLWVAVEVPVEVAEQADESRRAELIGSRQHPDLVGGEGFEPPTSSMSSWRSSN
jgi:hypothetical protein